MTTPGPCTEFTRLAAQDEGIPLAKRGDRSDQLALKLKQRAQRLIRRFP